MIGHGTTRRSKAVTRHPEGPGEGHQAGRGGRVSFAEREVNTKNRQADQERRGQRDRSPIEREAIESEDTR